jgi:hypothetical protein
MIASNMMTQPNERDEGRVDEDGVDGKCVRRSGEQPTLHMFYDTVNTEEKERRVKREYRAHERKMKGDEERGRKQATRTHDDSIAEIGLSISHCRTYADWQCSRRTCPINCRDLRSST